MSTSWFYCLVRNVRWLAPIPVRLGVRELAATAKVSIGTVARFESGDELKERTIEALQHALEAAGVEFIDENGGGPGVRLRKSGKEKPRK